MSLIESMNADPYVTENQDKEMVWCTTCNIPTADHGGTYVNCRQCRKNLVYRPPLEVVCGNGHKYVPPGPCPYCGA